MSHQFLLILTCLLVSFTESIGQRASFQDLGCTQIMRLQRQRTANSVYALRLKQTDTGVPDEQQATRVGETMYTIPVVVHVIHNGEAIGSVNNPSDATVQAMIGLLNNGFRKSGPLYGGVDTGIQFQLAIRSPQCGSTTGINRVNGSRISNYTAGGIAIETHEGSADEVAVKTLSRWPNTDYINIWIVNKINGNSQAGGFVWELQYSSALNDGIVICASAVNATDKTIIHQMGHIFNLQHTFDDNSGETSCPSLTACAATGDRVCDTEPVLNVPCSATLNTCTRAPFQTADAKLNYTVKNNYMSYTDCQWMFTQGQKERMRAMLVAYRNGLLTSGGLTAPSVGPPLACAVSATNGLSLYYGVERVKLNTLNVYSKSSADDGAFYVDRTCNQRTTLTAGQAYPLTIRPFYGNYQYIQAYLDYNADGDFDDANEKLLTRMDTSTTISIRVPTSGVQLNKPLRLRIIADNPDGKAPTACSLAGTPVEYQGVGQVEDYTVVVLPRTVTSVTSGDWTSPATWSCNCVPVDTDLVFIQASHIVSISNGLVQARAINLLGKLTYAADGRLKLAGN